MPRIIREIGLWFVPVVLLVLAPAGLRPAAAESTLAMSGVGGAFSLVDDNGKPVTEKSWPGKLKLVFFGYTHCPGVCPMTLDKLSGVLKKLGPSAAKLQPLFVTTDPERDTPAVMKEYVGHFDPSIVGLTGGTAQIKAAEDVYKVYAAKEENPDGKDYTVDHSAYLYLMSPDDKLLEILDPDAAAEVMLKKLQAHL